METLEPGAKGGDVEILQARLSKLGFPPGKIDGSFGPGTEAALRAFQQARGLLADGIAGPRTLSALGLADDPTLPSAIGDVTPEKVGVMFPVTPIRNIRRHLPPVLEAMAGADLREKPMILMALATIRAETEGFVPISERVSRLNTSPGGRPFDLYDRRTDIGNGRPGDGERYRGRGFVQLTGKANYLEHGRAIGLGRALVEDPEEANDATIAARLLASFLKARERGIKEALVRNDLAGARRLVNGGSHGLERFSDCYLRGRAVLG